MCSYPSQRRGAVLGQIERCRRLLSNPQMLLRLPDKGESVKARMRFLSEELEGADKLDKNLGPSACIIEEACCEDCAEEENTVEKREEEGITEKYQNYRCSIEDKIREIYEGVLTEKEMQRILDDIPANYLLTLPETQEMSKSLLHERRKYEMEKLRLGTSCGRSPPPFTRGSKEVIFP